MATGRRFWKLAEGVVRAVGTRAALRQQQVRQWAPWRRLVVQGKTHAVAKPWRRFRDSVISPPPGPWRVPEWWRLGRLRWAGGLFLGGAALGSADGSAEGQNPAAAAAGHRHTVVDLEIQGLLASLQPNMQEHPAADEAAAAAPLDVEVAEAAFAGVEEAAVPAAPQAGAAIVEEAADERTAARAAGTADAAEMQLEADVVELLDAAATVAPETAVASPTGPLSAAQLNPQQLTELEEQQRMAQTGLLAPQTEARETRNDAQLGRERAQAEQQALLSLHRARLRDTRYGLESDIQPEEEWRPGRDFDLVVRLNPNEGVNSMVFSIIRNGRQYALKALLNYSELPDRSQSCFLTSQFGAEWELIRSLPPHPCIITIVHYYFSREPDMRQHVSGILREYVAGRTAFVVTPLYDQSLKSFLKAQKVAHSDAPFGLPWRWFFLLLIQLLEAVRHLCAHNVVHGDIKPDQVLLTADLQAVLTDFGTAWKTVSRHGFPLTFQSEEDLDRCAGVGTYKAPELRGRVRPPQEGQDAIPLRDLYAKAESWTVGQVMFEVLQPPGRERDNDVFMRLANTTMQQLRVGRTQPQPGWEYDEADLPPLPPGTPLALREAIIGLTLSSCEERWSAERALRHLQADLWGCPSHGDDVTAWVQRRQLQVLQRALDEAVPVWETEMALRYFREVEDRAEA